MISRLRRTLLAAIGRPRLRPVAADAAAARAAPPTRNDADRRFDAARERLKAAIPPPAD